MNKRTIFLLLAFATFVTLGTHLLFKPIRDTSQTVAVQDVKALERGVKQLDVNLHSELKYLNNKKEQLQSQVQRTKAQIASAAKQVRKLTSDVQRLSTKSLNAVDTNTYIVTCDSLQCQINVLLSANSYRDSLVNKQVWQYELLLDNKDSTISCYKTDYSLLKQKSDEVLELNQQLVGENQHCHRALVRNKRSLKMMAGTVLLAAAVATVSRLRFAN